MNYDPDSGFYTGLEIKRLQERVQELENNQLMLIKRKLLKDVVNELDFQSNQAYRKGEMKYQCGIQKALEIINTHLGEYLNNGGSK